MYGTHLSILLFICVSVYTCLHLVKFIIALILAKIPKSSNSKWIKFNHNQVGYYRVNYELDHWTTLATNIGSFSVADKTHLLEEAFSIAESGQLTYNVPLNLTKYLKEETNYIPWSIAATKLSLLKRYLYGSLEYSRFLVRL